MSSAPIAELIHLGDILTGDAFLRGDFDHMYPTLTQELRGKPLGEGLAFTSLTRAKAEVTLDILNRLVGPCENAIKKCRKRIVASRRLRLAGQLVTLFGASSILGSLGFNKLAFAIATSIVTLISSGMALVSDYAFSVSSGGKTVDIQSCYDTLSASLFETILVTRDIKLLLDFSASDDLINNRVADANVLANRISGGMSQLLEPLGALAK